MLILGQLHLLDISPCTASQAADAEPITIFEYAEHNEYIFIGKVISKNVTTDQTYYIFNVTEYLKHPLNSTQIYRTEHGGSEVAVSPSTFYYVNIEYIMFFDEIDEDYRILGNHVYYKLLNSVDTEDIETIRQPIDVADPPEARAYGNGGVDIAPDEGYFEFN